MKKINIRKNFGITLIALVVTIVVLLILAATSISMLTGENGIITQAQKSQEETTVGEEIEKTKIAYSSAKANNLGNDVTKKDLQNELDNLVGKDKTLVNDTTDGNLNIFFTETEHNYKLVNGSVEKSDGNDVEKVLASGTVKEMIEAGEFEIGDYVIYNVENGKNTNEGEYSVSDDVTSYKEDESDTQIFNVKTYTGSWQVLYTGQEGYGLQIMSCGNVLGENEEGKLYFSGALGGSDDQLAYENAVETLNTICGYYVNTKYAASGRCLGSLPTDVETSIGTTERFDDFSHYLSGLKLDDENYKYDIEYQLLNTDKMEQRKSTIWLASRNADSSSDGLLQMIAIRNIDKDNNIQENDVLSLFSTGPTFNTYGYGICPVIKIKDNIEIRKTQDTNGNIVWKMS